MLNKFLNVVIVEKLLKKIFRFECCLPLKEFKNIDILTSITCAYKIYVTIIRNIILFIGIYNFFVVVKLVFSGRNTVALAFFHARADYHVTPG